jgi:hypothetical protein
MTRVAGGSCSALPSRNEVWPGKPAANSQRQIRTFTMPAVVHGYAAAIHAGAGHPDQLNRGCGVI